MEEGKTGYFYDFYFLFSAWAEDNHSQQNHITRTSLAFDWAGPDSEVQWKEVLENIYNDLAVISDTWKWECDSNL